MFENNFTMSAPKQSKRKSSKQKRSTRKKVITRSLGTIMSDRVLVTLKYYELGSCSLAATAAQGFRFSPSSCYDVNPLIGGTTMSGFNQLAQFYNKYRAHSSTCVLESSSPSATVPIWLTTLPMNTDPGSTPASALLTYASENRYAKSKFTSLVGGPVTSIHNAMSTVKITGNPNALKDEETASLVNTIPVNNWYWLIVFTSGQLIPTVQINWIFRMTVVVEFFDRTALTP